MARQKATKTNAKKDSSANLGFEAKLWLAADKLRNNMDAAEYKHIVLGLIFMFTGFNRLNHTDLWGHLNFGRWMATHHALPAADPFAAHPADAPVLQAAWLSQRLGHETQRLLGNEGLALATRCS
jgi:hypothetical protein